MNLQRWRQIDDLFQAVVELDPAQRTRFLEAACAGDDALRTDVESMLASDGDDWDFVDKPALQVAAPLLVDDQPQLAPGETIAHYRIIAALGRGGMGEVYLAQDGRLERKVALKLLPTAFSSDPSRMRRFQQEARAVSALNHPNILTIHDIGEFDGRLFIASEFIDGETLRQGLSRQRMPEKEALDIAIQIAGALSVAHEAGIVHRDIKPENVMLRRDGLVKVLDFGLAKLTETPVADQMLSEEQAIVALSFADEGKQVGDRVHTESGLLMGTPPYMSPEQLKGERLDARTDIFSLGVVIYEMLTGQTPFHREQMADVVAAILQTDAPPLTRRQLDATTEMERIVAKALRKERGERYQSVQELLLDLRGLGKESAVARPRRQRVVWALGVLALAMASALFWWLTRPPAKPRLSRLSKLAAYGTYTVDPDVSPDGKFLAFASDRTGEGHTDIWVRPFDRDEPMRLTNTSGNVRQPEFSPDGSEIAFESHVVGHEGIYVISTAGGEPRLVAEQGVGPRWSPDGKWLAYWVSPGSGSFGPDSARKVFLVPASGGEPQQFRPEFLIASFPVWSPDGTHIIFMGLRDREQAEKDGGNDWWVAPVEGGEAVKTGTIDIFHRQGLSAPPRRWATDNYIIFTSPKSNGGEGCNVWRIPLEPVSWKTQDRPEQLTFGTGQVYRVASLPDGRLVFSDQRGTINLWSLPVDAEKGKVTGEAQQLTRDEAPSAMPCLSADGDKLIYGSTRGGIGLLWLRELKSGREAKLNCPDWSFGPSVSPDGKAVVYATFTGPDLSSLFVMPLDGGEAERLVEGRLLKANGWLFTRNQVLYQVGGDQGEGSPQVFLLDINTKKPQVVLEHDEYKFSEVYPSPDDRWISFVASRQGHMRVFIAPLHADRATPESEWVAVTDGSRYDDQPRWSPGGALLYFISEQGGSTCIWAQRIDPGSKRPIGEAFAVYHFHDLQRNLSDRIVLAHDKIIFAREEVTGSIWLAEP
ncbi:MAG: protein kinase domain-containing protein [Blastocatellia bacterium]